MQWVSTLIRSWDDRYFDWGFLFSSFFHITSYITNAILMIIQHLQHDLYHQNTANRRLIVSLRRRKGVIIHTQQTDMDGGYTCQCFASGFVGLLWSSLIFRHWPRTRDQLQLGPSGGDSSHPPPPRGTSELGRVEWFWIERWSAGLFAKRQILSFSSCAALLFKMVATDQF
jgi:hypothetical protein